MTHGSSRRRYGAIARALVALVLAGAGLSFGTAARAADEVNVVRAIEVGEGAAGTEIRVKGSHEPTFTVFKLAEPARLVVDLAGSDVSGVDRLLEVNRGNVRAVLTTQFTEADARVGRVMVALEDDATYDVHADGNDVVVSVARPEGEAHAAATPAAKADEAAAAPAVEEKAEPVEVASAPETPAAAEAPAKPGLPEDVVKKDVLPLPKGVQAGTRVLAVGARTRGQVTTVAVRTDGPPARVETLELVDPARLAVDLHGMHRAPRRANLRRLGAAAPVKNVRIGRHGDKVRIVIDGDGARMKPYDVRRTRHGLAIVVRGGAAEPSVAEAAHEAPAKAGKAQVRALSYARTGDTGRAVLAIEDAGQVRYKLSRPDARTAVLTLAGTGLEGKLEHTFDTSRYGGAVRALTAFVEPGRKDRVKIVASLAGPVKSRIVPMAGGLSWEFDLASASEQIDGVAEREVTGSLAAGVATEGAVHVATSGETRRYTGRRVNLEFKDIDIHNVLRLLAEVSKRNIVVADNVGGTITLRLRNVPWDQALDLILRSKGLDKEVMGNIIRIAPADQLAKERQARLEASQQAVALEPLSVRLIPVNFATAADMSTKIKDVLSDRGSVTVDTRTNALIVKDIAAALERAEQLVRRLDTETPQVLIESRIVEANSNFTREVGVQWGGNVIASPAYGNPTGLVFPNIISMGGAATDGQTPTTGTSSNPNFAVNMPAPIGTNSGGGLGFIFGSVGGTVNLNLRLSAMENEGVVKTISAPKVVTLDNEQASISQGLSIPFSQVSAAGVNTTFIEAKLQLDVTPHVTADGSILMDISVTNNQPNPQLTGANGQPSISKKEAKTNAMVRDGETTVIGGIYTRQNSEAWNEVPGLSKIPILGWLFKKKNYQESRTELLVFITPRIVNRARSVPGAN